MYPRIYLTGSNFVSDKDFNVRNFNLGFWNYANYKHALQE
ncbi:hypothetical protein VIBNISOn1_410102 [Vibrio nigripulchritudo SOn1]|uniref:Uncharacterized protein n=1 Tax=Vibrio nigripulchritudo SOn1 TaxID=1238450 RepID=A0AAV2VU60_9VIBR|nr:hypothetical protein VIBNISOn1_410102 [Vibrio nigripulchritudo SOn1]